MQVLKITSQDEGQRLDKFLCKFMAEAPKSFFYKMLRKKNIVLNGKKAEGMEQLVKGDEIKLFLSDETIAGFRKKLPGTDTLLPGSCNITGITNITNILDIIYEDNDILIINKPAGILSQKADKNDISVVEYSRKNYKRASVHE